jgi:hypothetical protein
MDMAYLEPPVAVLDAAGMAAAFSTAGRPADARLTLRRHVLGKFMESHGYHARPAAPERGRSAVFRVHRRRAAPIRLEIRS